MCVLIKERFDSNFELYMKFHKDVGLGLNKVKEKGNHKEVGLEEYIDDFIVFVKTDGERLVNFLESDFDRLNLTQKENVKATGLKVMCINLILETVLLLEQYKKLFKK